MSISLPLSTPLLKQLQNQDYGNLLVLQEKFDNWQLPYPVL